MTYKEKRGVKYGCTQRIVHYVITPGAYTGGIKKAGQIVLLHHGFGETEVP